MSAVSSRLCARAGCAAIALCACAPSAASDVQLFSADNFDLTTIVRVVATDGEESWIDGGFGKVGSSGRGREMRIRPQLGEVNLVWQPQLGWALSGLVVGTLHGGERTEAGISEAFLAYRPMRTEKLRFSARAGLMWPPISLEHEGHDWHVADTATPSAINSWVGEEIRPLAIEGTVSGSVGAHRLSATAAVMAANDTSGTLLAFRGWALHDRKTLAFRRHRLPILPGAIAEVQPRFTHPLLDVERGFARSPGYYAKVAWQPPAPVRLEVFRYDNGADPEAVNHEMEWGWRTSFNQAAAVAELASGTQLKVQAMSGRTLMGFPEPDALWVDTRYRSAFGLVAHKFGLASVAGRVEVFETKQRGSLLGSESNESGWAATAAAKREFRWFTGLLEVLRVSSRRPFRTAAGEEPRQAQTQVQANMRVAW